MSRRSRMRRQIRREEIWKRRRKARQGRDSRADIGFKASFEDMVRVFATEECRAVAGEALGPQLKLLLNGGLAPSEVATTVAEVEIRIRSLAAELRAKYGEVTVEEETAFIETGGLKGLRIVPLGTDDS